MARKPPEIFWKGARKPPGRLWKAFWAGSCPHAKVPDHIPWGQMGRSLWDHLSAVLGELRPPLAL